MRKGVSPIIATVLLIAITITIASTVYRSSNEFITQLAPAPYCERVSFDAGIHIDRGLLYLEVTNTGNEVIEGLNLQKKDEFENVDVQKIDLIVNPGQSISQEISLGDINGQQLYLIPIIKNAEGTPVPCDYVFAKPLNAKITGFIIADI